MLLLALHEVVPWNGTVWFSAANQVVFEALSPEELRATSTVALCAVGMVSGISGNELRNLALD